MRHVALALLVGMIIIGITLWPLDAQVPQAQKPAFEVASVKPVQFPPGFTASRTAAPAIIHVIGNGVSVRSSVTNLVLAAYNLKGFQISGAPPWANSTWYEISAKAEENSSPSAEHARQMLQTLLADRFQLRFHHDNKEVAVYDLVVGKNGSKLKESQGERPPVPLQQNGSQIRFNVFNRDMANIIDMISVGFDRPVLDKTSLIGRYDMVLEFSRNNPDLHPFDSPEADHSIFDAVEQQLGLKFVPAKERVEVIVIDSVERPTEN